MACDNADTPSTQLSQLAAEEAVLCLVNEERVARGIPALTLNTKLRNAARQQAQAAATLKWWAGGGPMVHVNPQTGSTPQSRIRDAGYCPVEQDAPSNENAYDAFYQGGAAFQAATSPQAAVDWWMGSQPHRETLLNPTYRESGVAVVLGIAERGPQADLADGGAIFVQTFGGCPEIERAVPTEAWAWGINMRGEIGDGTIVERDTPVQPQNPTEVVDVAGYDHSLAVKEDGTVWAWGVNASGQLGDGTTTDRNVPGEVPGLSQVTAVAAGHEHSLALKNDGTVWAWGRNRYGQLGDGTNADRLRPVQVRGLIGVTQIAAGGDHSLALKNDDSAWGWGANFTGQLGDGTLDDRVMPVKVDTLSFHSRLVAIAAGNQHSLALEEGSGQVWVWGGNSHSELGDGGSHPYVWLPIELAFVREMIAVAGGNGHSLALKNDGTRVELGRQRVWTTGQRHHRTGLQARTNSPPKRSGQPRGGSLP